jgi:hypothetical protein
MPSLRHDGLVELVRQHPPLAVDLVRLANAYPLPANVVAVLGSEDMTDVAPVSNDPDPKPQKYTADSVVVVSDPATGERLLAIVVEPQGRADDDKDESWPVYVTTARRANDCPASALIVLCWDMAEARKCRRTIYVGPRGFNLTPDVIDRGYTPDLTRADPYTALCFTLLKAVDMETDEGQDQVLDAMVAAARNQSDHEALTAIILGLASAAARKRMEQKMSTTFKSEFIDSWKQAGLEEGRAQGIHQGEAQAKAQDILKVLNSRGLKPTDKQREQVTTSTDLAQLDLWFDRALTATSADEVFRR